jgi:hypothetical protein
MIPVTKDDSKFIIVCVNFLLRVEYKWRTKAIHILPLFRGVGERPKSL